MKIEFIKNLEIKKYIFSKKILFAVIYRIIKLTILIFIIKIMIKKFKHKIKFNKKYKNNKKISNKDT